MNMKQKLHEDESKSEIRQQVQEVSKHLLYSLSTFVLQKMIGGDDDLQFDDIAFGDEFKSFYDMKMPELQMNDDLLKGFEPILDDKDSELNKLVDKQLNESASGLGDQYSKLKQKVSNTRGLDVNKVSKMTSTINSEMNTVFGKNGEKVSNMDVDQWEKHTQGFINGFEAPKNPNILA